MTRDELHALAARVEAATGPDRALDGEVFASAGGGWDGPYAQMMAPPYTSSLDAAASLERPHYRVYVVRHGARTTAKISDARVSLPVAEATASGAHAEARARTAAALRAMAEEARDD